MFEMIGEDLTGQLCGIVDQYDFSLPKLYEEMSDEEIFAYVCLFTSEHAEFVQLVELIEEIGGFAGGGGDEGEEFDDEYLQSLQGVESIEVYSDGHLLKTISDEGDLHAIIAALCVQLHPVEMPAPEEYGFVCRLSTGTETFEAGISASSVTLLGRTFEIPEEVSWLFNTLTSKPSTVE